MRYCSSKIYVGTLLLLALNFAACSDWGASNATVNAHDYSEATTFEDFLVAYDAPGDNEEYLRIFEDELAKCMAEKGFEYVPYNPEPPKRPSVADNMRRQLMSTWYHEQGKVDPGADPNLALIEQYDTTAYNIAFFGPSGEPPEMPEGDNVQFNDYVLSEPSQQGCQDTASNVASDQTGVKEIWERQFNFNKLYNGFLAADPEVIDVESAVLACEQDNGASTLDTRLETEIVRANRLRDLDLATIEAATASIEEAEDARRDLRIQCEERHNYGPTILAARERAFLAAREGL